MGYTFRVDATDFKILKERQTEALQAVKRLFKDKSTRFSWVHHEDAVRAKDLNEFLGEWRWTPSYDKAGNIVDVSFIGEKIGDEDTLFDALGPYVEAGSTIECTGEDGSFWRWRFCGLHCHNEGGSRVYSEQECEGRVL